MRIAFQTGYRNALADIERSAEDLARYQRQVSSGRRLEVPSDDPTAAVAAVSEHTEIGTLDQYKAASDSANSRLTVIDTVLGDMIDKLTTAQAVTASALGNTATPAQRDAAARELAGLRDALFGDYNTQFRGVYLFSGTALTTAPYAKNPDESVTAYLGDAGAQSVDIDRQIAVQVSYDGSSIAQGSDASSVFTVLQNLITDVQTGDQAAIQAGLDGLRRAFDRATAAQTRVGTDERAVEDDQARLSAMRLASRTRLSAEEDVNMAEAISGLSQADAAHQAALGAAATISRVSLLDYLK
jgi:flagellar hook-associated protein 3 FlgL